MGNFSRLKAIASSLPNHVRLKVVLAVTGLVLLNLVLAFVSPVLWLACVAILVFALTYYLWQIVPQLSVPWQADIWKGNSLLPAGQVLVTFDDAPSRITQKLLDILDGFAVKAIFFLVEQNSRIHPEAVHSIIKRGHLVACHGSQHKCYRWKKRAFIENDITKCLELLKSHFGIVVRIFRSPHGQRTTALGRVIKNHNLVHLSWHRGFWDTDPTVTFDQLIERSERIRGGEILLFHDGVDTQTSADRSALLNSLPVILENLEQRGIHFANPFEYCGESLKIDRPMFFPDKSNISPVAS